MIAPAPDDVFLEIGPGRGALTLPLAERAARIVAVELDARLADTLRLRLPGNVELVEGDALVAPLRSLVPQGARLAGNLPYYISSPLLRRVLDLSDHLRDAHVMVQEEVAERVASSSGTKEYGVLSVLSAVRAEVDIVRRFGPRAFDPPPKVRSAVLRLRFRATPLAPAETQHALETLVLRGFARRRRTLANNLTAHYPHVRMALEHVRVDPTRRAETVTPEEWTQLATALGAVPSDNGLGGESYVGAPGSRRAIDRRT